MGIGATVPNASIDRTGEQFRLDWSAHKQPKGVDVLRDCRTLASEVRLRCVENLLSLVEVGSRRNSAFKAKTRQANALLGARGSFLIDQQQAGIRGMIEPSRRNIRDQRQARGPRPGLRREIAIELNVRERANPAEQVELQSSER